MLAQPTGLDLAPQERDSAIQERPHVLGDRDLQPPAALDRLAPPDDDEVVVGGEELQARVDQRRDALEADRARPTRRGSSSSAQSCIASSITAAYSRSLEPKW